MKRIRRLVPASLSQTLLLFCLVSAPAFARIPASRVTLVEENQRGVTLAFESRADIAELAGERGWTLHEEEGAAAFPYTSIPIAIPPGASARLEIANVRTRSLGVRAVGIGTGEIDRPFRDSKVEERSPEHVTPWARVTEPGFVRDQAVVALVIDPVRFSGDRHGTIEALSSATFHVRFERGSANEHEGVAGVADARVGGGVAPVEPPAEAVYENLTVNASSSRSWRAKTSTGRATSSRAAASRSPLQAGDSFSSSSDWLRLTVSRRGMTRVTYRDFLDAGLLNPRDAVGDPRTLRIYTGTGRELPESITEPRRAWMDQTAILVSGAGDGTFDPGDAVEFYALPPDDFADYFDASPPPASDSATAPGDVWTFHRYTDDGVYWLTWGGDFEEPARRMDPTRVTTTAAASVRDRGATRAAAVHRPGAATFRERVHFENGLHLDLTRFGTDLHFIDELTTSRPDKTFRVDLAGVAPGTTATLRMQLIARTNTRTGDSGGSQDVRFRIDANDPDSAQWNSAKITGGRITPRLLVDSTLSVANGTNGVRVEARRRAGLWVDWIEIFYRRMFEAVDGVLAFSIDPGEGAVSIGGLSETARVFDVTDRLAPRVLTGMERVGDRVALGLEPDARIHLIALDDGAWHAPAAITLTSPEDLRGITSGAEYVAITGPFFFDEIETLVRHRGLDYTTYVARIGDVFAGYAWGLPDPTAIRDFLADAYARWETRPLFVEFAGDATTNLANRPELVTNNRNDVPSHLFDDPRGRADFTFQSDDFFALLHPDTLDDPLPDVAIGRIPAQNEPELRRAQQKIVSYDTNPESGPWKNRALFVADDHLRGSETEGDCAFTTSHTTDTETLARGIGNAFEPRKVYLTEYPIEGNGGKPAARDAFLDEWEASHLFSSFIGHGGFDRMTDENLFSFADARPDVLKNGDRLPLFTAWSCSVGAFDLQGAQSIGERLLLMQGGGAVGTIGATADAFGSSSFRLAERFFDALFPAAHETVPIGIAAMIAKGDPGGSASYHLNSRKYNLLGDAATVLAAPKLGIVFDDTLSFARGVVSSIAGSVVDSTGAAETGFRGDVLLTVHEMSDTLGFVYTDSICALTPAERRAPYTLTGDLVYTATLPVENGRFTTEFVAASRARAGSLARISAWAVSRSMLVDASGGTDSAAITPGPVTLPYDDDEPPRVTFAIDSPVAGDPVPLTVDTPVEVAVRDTSGISVLQSDEFERMQVRVDGGAGIPLLPFFTQDPADFRAGRLNFTLEELLAPASLGLGRHELSFTFTDARGNRGATDLAVRVIQDAGAFGFLQDVLSYPNPFDPEREESVFYADFGSIGSLTIEIFTVNGRRVRRFEHCVAAGAEKLDCAWDGTDEDGDVVANGVYIVRAIAESADGSERDESIGRIVVLREGDRRIRR